MSKSGPDIDVPPGVLVGWVERSGRFSISRREFLGCPEDSVHEASEYMKKLWPTNGIEHVESFVKERWEVCVFVPRGLEDQRNENVPRDEG